MKRIAIVGLGNPGEKYEKNRHNAGKIFVSHLAENFNLKFSLEKKIKNEVASFSFKAKKILLAKPITFMNLSGEAVKKLVDYYKINTENLYIVHDDLDIPLGKFRIDFARGPKLHNGLLSIEQQLKTKNFWRVRIGVDNRQKTGWIEGETYVLTNFTQNELLTLKQSLKEIETKLLNKL